MPSPAYSRLLECPECLKSFSRPSHLTRHRATHLEPSTRGSIPCPQCDTTFSRRDVLLRHLRSAHQFDGRARRSVQRSCFRCVEKKLKCGRTRPCNACHRSGAVCEYPASGRPDLEMSEALQSQDRDWTPRDEPRNVAEYPGLERAGGFEAGLVASLATPDSTLSESTTHHVDRTYEATYQTDDLTGMDTVSALPNSVDMTLDSFVPDIGGTYPENLGMTPSNFSLMQPSFISGGLDWLGVYIDDGTYGSGGHIGEDFDSSQFAPPQEQGTEGPGLELTDSADQRLFGPGWTTHEQPPPRPLSTQQTSLPWPFEQGKDSNPPRYKLPPIREVLSEDLRTSRPIQRTLVNGFIHILSGCRLPQLTALQDNDHVQAYHSFQRLVDTYFAQFHDIQAVIHRPTWDMASCPTVLLTAMACMGAMLSDRKSDAELSQALSDICSTMITWMGASDGTNYSDISYLNALCIHQIYSLGSGNRQLYQSADRSRGILVGGLRGVGLLQSRPNVDTHEEQEVIKATSDAGALHLEWRSWIARESGRRAAWAAFEYDCSLCTLTSRRGVVDLSELPALLPCADHIWSATSAQAWYALQSRLGAQNSISPRLSTTLKLALAGRGLPSVLGCWAKRLCSQVIGRLLWDLKQLEVMAMPEYCGLSSLISAHRDTKTSLLRGLDTLVEALSAPSSTSDLISYNISGLLSHYSHLYAASDVLDIIVYIVRNLISSAAENDGIEVARQRLKMTFASDPQTSRRLCWHAAQIVVIANEYLVSAPCEILRVFMGYIFVLAYSAYGPREATSPGPETVRLDLSNRDSSQRRRVIKWIQSGGPASLGSVQDLCADGCIPSISRDAQAMMQKLRCWGLADKFTRMFQVFETKGF